jgi:hypothetical protein
MNAYIRTESHSHILDRVRAEYAEMPGLSLTGVQARRLFGLDEGECPEVLAVLVREGFLRLTDVGMYVRPSVRIPPRKSSSFEQSA